MVIGMARTSTSSDQRMRYPDYIDAEMRELLDALSKCIVPRKNRRDVYRTNYHVPYYTAGRYRRVA